MVVCYNWTICLTVCVSHGNALRRLVRISKTLEQTDEVHQWLGVFFTRFGNLVIILKMEDKKPRHQNGIRQESMTFLRIHVSFVSLPAL